ncbi:hypothetical protein CVT26_012760 [Gymnopilus dilepis]|uniref:Uncharacterized protein n=1 Tax=Gymnopilus dilepis TaxID=231916 RepID=A0A409WVB7_9AGAR|nr:hypothetical protein CVT26_012760 [Gymnopilus dilepis]
MALANLTSTQTVDYHRVSQWPVIKEEDLSHNGVSQESRAAETIVKTYIGKEKQRVSRQLMVTWTCLNVLLSTEPAPNVESAGEIKQSHDAL